MSGDELAAALERGGLAAEDVAAKLALFDACAVRRAQSGWEPGEHAWWIPGRLEVFGKHTDYAGGRTLVAALPRGFAMTAGRARGSRPEVSVADARTGDTVTVGRAADNTRLTGWGGYVEAVVRRLSRNFPGVVLSAEIVFASDLPPAAGMSSSSALMVGLATALVRLASIESRPEWQTNVGGPVDAAGYFACIENGATFRTLEGDAGVGTHGGSEDHAAILCAEAARLTAYAFVPLRPVTTVGVPSQWRFVVASSGVIAEKTGSARRVYNALAADAATLLQLWNTHEPGAASLASAMAAGEWAPARLSDILRSSCPAGPTIDALERRLTHFLREDRRVEEALGAFSRGDAEALADLAASSQRDAEMLLRNQVPATVALAASARELGAISACSFGAGFGGSVWALVAHDAARAFPGRWLQACSRTCLPGAVAFEATPGPPLMELTLTGST